MLKKTDLEAKKKAYHLLEKIVQGEYSYLGSKVDKRWDKDAKMQRCKNNTSTMDPPFIVVYVKEFFLLLS